jgi:tripartite-type tricarboxylate transporter receptor subunit TctC
MKVKHLPAMICAAVCSGILFGLDAAAQGHPSGPVRIIVPSAAGGGPDVIVRIIAEQLARSWKRQVVVVNNPGAGGVIAMRAAGTAAPDGHTLYAAITSNFIALPEVKKNQPYDLARDFTPIGLIYQQPMLVAVNAALGVNSLAELFALANRRRGELNLAVLSRGGLPHLTGELLRRASGADLTVVHYPGAPQALTDVLAGNSHVLIESLPALSGSVSGGSLKALGIASPQRLPDFPDLPTVAETLPGFRAIGWVALMAPPATPEPIARKVSEDLRAALAWPEVQRRFRDIGTYVHPTSPAELLSFIHEEQERWKPVIAEIASSQK